MLATWSGVDDVPDDTIVTMMITDGVRRRRTCRSPEWLIYDLFAFRDGERWQDDTRQLADDATQPFSRTMSRQGLGGTAHRGVVTGVSGE